MATINDVARECGVSPTTVSFVLNNGPRPVSARTRQRVQEAMHRLNYRPNGVARGLARQRMHTLGVIFSGHNPRIIHNAYAIGMLDGIVAMASTRGYNVTLITQLWKSAAESAATICDGRNDGILVLSPLMGSDVMVGLAAQGAPLIQVGASSVLPGVPWLDVDNNAGARMAARHLLELGHRHFALLLGPAEYQHVEERQTGFLSELAAAGIAPRDVIRAGCYTDEQEGDRIALSLLRRDTRPTAVLTTNDGLANAVLRVAKTLGIDVPGDLSVTGFDDAQQYDSIPSQLTTVRQPLFEMGQAAAERLIDSIEKRYDEDVLARPILFAPELAVRGSTGIAPSK